MMNRCLHKDPHKLSNCCTSLHSQHTAPPLTTAEAVQPVGDLPHQPLADVTVLAPGTADQAVGGQPDVDDPFDQLITVPLLPAATDDQPGADGLLHQPVLPTVDLLDDQQPPDPPDQDQGQPRRSRRVARRKFACLNLDNF